MAKKTTVAIAHSDADLGNRPNTAGSNWIQSKAMIRGIADQTMGGMDNIVTQGRQGPDQDQHRDPGARPTRASPPIRACWKR